MVRSVVRWVEKSQIVVVVLAGVFVRQHDVSFEAGVVMHAFGQTACAAGKKVGGGSR